MSNREDDPDAHRDADADAGDPLGADREEWGAAWREDESRTDDDSRSTGVAPGADGDSSTAAGASRSDGDSESALADDLLGPKPRAERGPPERSRRFKVVEAVVHLVMFGLSIVLIGAFGVLAAGSEPLFAAIFAILLLVTLVNVESNLDEWATWVTELLVEE